MSGLPGGISTSKWAAVSPTSGCCGHRRRSRAVHPGAGPFPAVARVAPAQALAAFRGTITRCHPSRPAPKRVSPDGEPARDAQVGVEDQFQAHDPSRGHKHRPVDRPSLGNRLHTRRVRLFTPYGETLESGRLGRLPMLLQPLPVLLGSAPAPGVHPVRVADHLGPDRPENKKARQPERAPRERHEPGNSFALLGPRRGPRRSEGVR